MGKEDFKLEISHYNGEVYIKATSFQAFLIYKKPDLQMSKAKMSLLNKLIEEVGRISKLPEPEQPPN